DRLAAFSARLHPRSPREDEDLRQLEQLLVQVHGPDLAAAGPRELSIDRATWFAPENLPPDRRERLQRLVESTDPRQLPRYRVFRRDTPAVTAPLDVSVPAWGRGAAVSRTAGPFTTADGRQAWFDFYALARLIPVYFAGDEHPAFLFQGSRIRPERPDLDTGRAAAYEISAGSFWIRAHLLAPDAPPQTYIGLRVGGGR